MEAIPVPQELIVPLAAILLATVSFLLKDLNKGKKLKNQIWNVAQGFLGIVISILVVLKVLLGITGWAWTSFVQNKFVVAFLGELEIESSATPEWLTLLVAIGIFYLSLTVAAGNGTSVWGKIGDVLVNYLFFLVILGIVLGFFLALTNMALGAFFENKYVLSLLEEFGLLP